MRTIVHIHIPRTAGRSMKRIAMEQFSSYLDITKRRTFVSPVDFMTLGHASPKALIKKGVFTQQWWDAAFRFAFVRNPWDRLISLFYNFRKFRLRRYRLKTCKKSNVFLHNFDDFVKEITSGSKWVKPISLNAVSPYFRQANPQVEWLRYGVDFVGRFESLQSDWKRLCGIIGMEYKTLPQYGGAEGRSKNYRDHYTMSTRDMVARFYAEDIRRFNYTF